MKRPHFFKAHSRIGLQFAPYRMNFPNYGVEDGSDFILTKKFVAQFPNSSVSKFKFSLPENYNGNLNRIFIKEMLQFSKFIEKSVKKGELTIVVGGDNSISFATILETLKSQKRKKVGYIHFDSHPDANLWSESPTKNWHGMYLRPFLSEFDLPEIEKEVPRKILPQHTLFVGNLDADPGEKRLIKELGLLNIDRFMIRKKKRRVIEQIKNLLRKIEFLYINFDIDVFDQSLAPATAIPTNGGFLKEDIFPILTLLRKYPNFALNLVEVNPKKVGGSRTVHLAQEILAFMLK